MASVKVINGSAGAKIEVSLDVGDTLVSDSTGVHITNAPTLTVEPVSAPQSAPAAVATAQAPQFVAAPAPAAQPVAAGPSAVVVS